MPKAKDYGEAVGKCEICTINCWSSADGKPVVWPCNIAGCPYEDPEQQNTRSLIELRSPIGSSLTHL